MLGKNTHERYMTTRGSYYGYRVGQKVVIKRTKEEAKILGWWKPRRAVLKIRGIKEPAIMYFGGFKKKHSSKRK